MAIRYAPSAILAIASVAFLPIGCFFPDFALWGLCNTLRLNLISGVRYFNKYPKCK